ncbi:MAG: YkvA family protein [Pseudomonadota bacterium]
MNFHATAGFVRLARALPAYAMIRRAARDISAGDAGPYARDVSYVEHGFWAKARRLAGRIPFAMDLSAAWYCAMDRTTPAHVKAILMGALAYFVVPADIVPDVILGAGLIDDATVLATAVSSVAGHIKPQHFDKARKALALQAEPSGN